MGFFSPSSIINAFVTSAIWLSSLFLLIKKGNFYQNYDSVHFLASRRLVKKSKTRADPFFNGRYEFTSLFQGELTPHLETVAAYHVIANMLPILVKPSAKGTRGGKILITP